MNCAILLCARYKKMNLECINFNILAMGIYSFTNLEFVCIKEIKGRFWVIAEFRQFEDMCCTFDLIKGEAYAERRERWNIPMYGVKGEDGNYVSGYWNGEKYVNRIFTPEQHYFLKRVIWKYLMQDSTLVLIKDIT